MDDIVHHLRDVAASRKAADELRAQQLVMMQYLRDVSAEIEDVELKAARAIEIIADLSQRIEELGQ
jgi:hypothetical protein